MIECSQDFITALKQPIKQLYLKIEFYDSNMNLITSFEQDVAKYQNFRGGTSGSHFTKYGTMRKMNQKRLGGISVDYTRPVRRSISFGFGNDDNVFGWGVTSPIWIANRFKVYTGLKLANGTIEYIPQGLFIITAPSDSHNAADGKNVYITGQDKAYLFTGNRGKFVNELTVQSGVNIGVAIKQIASDGGETMFNFDNVTDTLPYDMTFHVSDTRWKAMSDLAKLAQCDIFYDVNGFLRLQKIVTDFSKEPAQWTYKYGDPKERFYAGNIRAFDETNLANHIRVVGGSSQTAVVTYDLVVDQTVPYTISQTIAETQQFQAGTYNNTMNVPDSNDGSVGLLSVGTNFSKSEITQTDFSQGTISNINSIDDTDYLQPVPVQKGHIELTGYRNDWTKTDPNTGLVSTAGQTKYGVGSTDSVTSTPNSYTLTSASGTHAMSRLNGTDSLGADLTIQCNITVPAVPASGVAQAGLVYRQNYWSDTDGTEGYFAGFGSNGHFIFGRGTNSSTVTWTSLSDVDFSVSSSSPYLNVGTTHVLKVIVQGSVHTFFIDGIQVAQVTDSTFTQAGGYGLRVYDGTGVFTNYGIYPSATTYTGTRVETFDLSSVSVAGTSSISFADQNPSNNTTTTVDYSLSTDGGTTWGAWVTVTSGGSISGIVAGMNMANVKIQIRETLSTSDPTLTPQLSDLVISINSEYKTSGTYTSNKFPITVTSANPVANSAKISWNATVPSNTTLSVQYSYSTDNGITWSLFTNCNNGDIITGVTSSVDVSQLQFQFIANFSTTDVTASPLLEDLTIQVDAPIWQNSPYSIQKIGDVVYVHNNGNPDPLISTLYQAKWRAKYELMKRLGYSEKLQMEIAPNYIHDAGDIIEVEDSENNVTGNYRLQSFEVPLIPQIMEVQLVKYEQVINDWNAI